MRWGPVLVLLAACGSSTDDTIDITHDVCAPIALAPAAATPDQLTGIARAVDLWRGRGVASIDVAAGTSAIEIRFERASAAFHGLYDDRTGVVYVNQGIDEPAVLAIVIAHELGHAFGLPHVDREERPSLMNPGNLVTPPSDADQRALESLWGPCE